MGTLRLALILALSLGLCSCSSGQRRRVREVKRVFTLETYLDEGRPELRSTHREINARLRSYRQRLEQRHASEPESLRRHDPAKFREVTHAVDWCLARGLLKPAERFIEDHHAATGAEASLFFADDPRLIAAATVTATYHRDGGGGAIFCTIERLRQSGRIAVIFPPGTYGRPYKAPRNDKDFGNWPEAHEGNEAGIPKEQDLVFLESKIIWLEPGAQEAEIRIPVACGRYNRGEPQEGQNFVIERFKPNLPIHQLVTELTLTTRGFLNHAAAQIAVWVVREDIDWEDYRRKTKVDGPSLVFETGKPITERDVLEAGDLMIDAGLDPRRTHFFAVPK